MYINSFKLMAETLPNSYLHRYELKNKDSKSLSKSTSKIVSPDASPLDQANTLGTVVAKLTDRVDSIDIKLSSLYNVVKLLQRYSETRDQQYEKEKEQEIYKQMHGVEVNQHNSQLELKIKEFDLMAKQFREEMKSMERMKANLVLSEVHSEREEAGRDQSLADLQTRLRDELNKKMDICVRLINTAAQSDKPSHEKMSELSFNLNQLENECRRNRMMFEKDIDNLTALIKENSTAVPHNHSRLTNPDVSRSPLKAQKSRSRNSKSDRSLSKGKQNRSAVTIQPPKDSSKIRDEQLREALRKKKEHRERLRVKNW